MGESEVDKDTSLWFTIFTFDHVLILTINISQESLTEVVVIRMVVNGKILTLTKVLLFTLGNDLK